MTTPSTMGRLLTELRENIALAEENALESHRAAMNSYGAGYDRGYADALKEVLKSITGDEAEARDKDFMAIGPTGELID